MDESIIEFLFYLVFYVLIPCWISWRFFRRAPKQKYLFYLMGIVCLFLSTFAYAKGQYEVLGSFYIRYLMVLPIIAVLWTIVKQNKALLGSSLSSLKLKAYASILAIASFILAYVNYNIYTSYSLETEAVELAFPLKDGDFLVRGGSSNSSTNYHYASNYIQQRYAIDISSLNTLGANRRGLFVDALEDYNIFGHEIYSPCAGQVVEQENAIKDNQLKHYASDAGEGNYITLQCGEYRVSLFHMQEGSVLVNIGDQLSIGDRVGKVGNSGFSTDPHLHMQATKITDDGTELPVAMSFDGRYLTNGDRVAK